MKRIFILFLLTLPAYAQILDAGSTARAGVHDLSRKTPGVLSWNTAVLAGDSSFTTSIEAVSFVGAAANNSFTVAFWNRQFGSDRYLTERDKHDIMDKIPDDGFRLDAQATSPLLGVTYNKFAAAVTMRASSTANVPKEIVRLALFGNRLNHLYRLADFDAHEQVMLDYALGFGWKYEQDWIQSLTFGPAFHFYQGTNFSKIVQASGNLIVTDTSVSGSGVLHSVYSQRGDGVAFDLGALAVINNHWQAGLSFNQIGAKMSWKVKENHIRYFYTDSSGVSFDSLRAGGSGFHDDDVTVPGGTVNADMPMVVRMNGRYHHSRRWNAMTEMLYRTKNGPEGREGLEAGLAGEYFPLRWLNLQTGVSGGGPWELRLGLGGGLRFSHYELDMGWAWNGGVLNGARGVSFGLSQRLKF